MRPDVDFSHLRDKYTYDTMSGTGMIISGDPEHWIDKVRALEAIGVDDLAVNFVAIEHKAALSAIELYGPRSATRIPICGGADVTTPVDGAVYSFTVLHRSFPGFDTPFTIGWIDLHDGRRILARIDADERIAVGDNVRLDSGSTDINDLATFRRADRRAPT